MTEQVVGTSLAKRLLTQMAAVSVHLYCSYNCTQKWGFSESFYQHLWLAVD
jgi:hypothetical protein